VVNQHVSQITESFNAHRHDETKKFTEAAFKEFKSGTLERSYLRVALARLNGLDHPEMDLTPAPQALDTNQFLSRFRAAVKIAVDRHPEFSKRLSTLSKHVEMAVSRKEVFPGQNLLMELSNTELTPVQTDELLSIFTIQPHEGASNAVLNDVLNAHPLAAKMVGERIGEFLKDYVSYTETYKEGADTLFPDASHDPHVESAYRKDAHFDSPTPNHPPFNSPIEEIYQWKLERLAQIFNFDLGTPLGLSQFEIFSHNYDLSPGDSLDRVHALPPWYHTYEELPIIKFDGYDPLDFEAPHTPSKELSVTETELKDISKFIPGSKK